MAQGDTGRLEAPTELDAAGIVSGDEPARCALRGDRGLCRHRTTSAVCARGEFDISFRPAGFDGGYAQLIDRAHRVAVDGVEVLVADLDDVIRSKELAGRPKDIRVLPALYRHRESRRVT